MKFYKVTWEIELFASDPKDAAEQALNYIQTGGAHVFKVQEIGEVTDKEIENPITIDLDED